MVPKKAMPDFVLQHIERQQKSANDSLSEGERQRRRDEEEWDRLEVFRKKLVPGETRIIATAPHLGGTVIGTFKKLEGYRIKFSDDNTQVLYTCNPSEVNFGLI
jgi:hypothetical protein